MSEIGGKRVTQFLLRITYLYFSASIYEYIKNTQDYGNSFTTNFVFRVNTHTPSLYAFKMSKNHYWSRDSSVSIVSGYRLDYRAIEVRSPARTEQFSSSLCDQTGSVAHLSSCTMSTGSPFPEGNARPGREADHSPPSSAEVVNE
jgi:hypothetical protein